MHSLVHWFRGARGVFGFVGPCAMCAVGCKVAWHTAGMCDASSLELGLLLEWLQKGCSLCSEQAGDLKYTLDMVRRMGTLSRHLPLVALSAGVRASGSSLHCCAHIRGVEWAALYIFLCADPHDLCVSKWQWSALLRC
jgi:hypothetical protein